VSFALSIDWWQELSANFVILIHYWPFFTEITIKFFFFFAIISFQGLALYVLILGWRIASS
jgi:hypothetical protein